MISKLTSTNGTSIPSSTRYRKSDSDWMKAEKNVNKGNFDFLYLEKNVFLFWAKNRQLFLPWWSCPWPIPTFALKTSKSARSRSKWRPPLPPIDDGRIILNLFSLFSTLASDYETCFLSKFPSDFSSETSFFWLLHSTDSPSEDQRAQLLSKTEHFGENLRTKSLWWQTAGANFIKTK